MTGLVGCFRIVHRADPLNHIAETDEGDNMATRRSCASRIARARSAARASPERVTRIGPLMAPRLLQSFV